MGHREVKEVELSETEVIQLQTLVRIARDKALDGQRIMTQCAESGGNPMISVDEAEQMAEMHRVNKDAASGLIKKLNGAITVWVQY